MQLINQKILKSAILAACSDYETYLKYWACKFVYGSHKVYPNRVRKMLNDSQNLPSVVAYLILSHSAITTFEKVLIQQIEKHDVFLLSEYCQFLLDQDDASLLEAENLTDTTDRLLTVAYNLRAHLAKQIDPELVKSAGACFFANNGSEATKCYWFCVYAQRSHIKGLLFYQHNNAFKHDIDVKISCVDKSEQLQHILLGFFKSIGQSERDINSLFAELLPDYEKQRVPYLQNFLLNLLNDIASKSEFVNYYYKVIAVALIENNFLKTSNIVSVGKSFASQMYLVRSILQLAKRVLLVDLAQQEFIQYQQDKVDGTDFVKDCIDAIGNKAIYLNKFKQSLIGKSSKEMKVIGMYMTHNEDEEEVGKKIVSAVL